ncbi:MAG: DUF167 domain-containing protein [Candidatus Magasanikbacteria bacterium]|jgi:uncharacterized protein|nr:DUF167 domain-containing protein [Candidatus Magasanikbacteria bacterium]
MKELRVTISPASSKNEVCEQMADGSLKVCVTAPPVGGKANTAVIALLAKHLGIKPYNISLKSGKTSKKKVFIISL